MERRSLVIAVLALCGAVSAASAAGSHKHRVRPTDERPVIEETRADVAAPAVKSPPSTASVTVLDKPYDAPLPISGPDAGGPGLPIANAPPPPRPPPPMWRVKDGAYLSDTLRDWAKVSGWAVVWRMSEQEDFRMDAGNLYQGEFKKAVADLFNSLPPSVRLHAELRPDNVPPLLYVTRDGVEGR